MRIGEGREGLARGLTALAGLLERHGIGRRARYQAELVFEELVSNVQRHGGDGAAAPEIDVTIDFAAEDIVLVFSDTARPFDPLQPRLPVAGASSGATIGGKGLVLVREAARAISYERSGGRNRVTVRIARD